MNKNQMVSIILPAYNEEKIIGRVLSRLHKELKSYPLDFEIVVIENGSIDKTQQVVRRLTKTFPKIRMENLSSPSYGLALKRGIETARGNKVICLNVDFYDLDFLRKAAELLDKFDIVVGSKNLRGASDRRPLLRKLITRIFNFLMKLIFNFKGTDTHGLKALKRDKLLPVLSACRTDREILDTELILRSQRCGLNMKELPVTVRETRPTRLSLIYRIGPTFTDLCKLTFLISPHPFIKYCIVGISNTVVDWSVYLLLTRLSGFWLLHFLWAKTISFIFGTTNSFIFNRLWTFKSKDRQITRQFLRFSAVNCLALVLNVGTMYFAVEKLKLSDLVGLILATFVSLALGFSLNRYWTFKNREISVENPHL